MRDGVTSPSLTLYHVRRGEGREPSCDLISRSSKNRSGREPRQREQGKPNTRVERFKAVICNRPLRVRQPRAAPVPHVRQHSLSVWVGAVLHRREVSLHDAGASARVQVMHRLPPVTAPSNSARGARGSGQSFSLKRSLGRALEARGHDQAVLHAHR